MDSKRKHLVIAIVVGSIALLGNKWYMNQQIDQLRPKRITSIVRTKKPIPAGSILSAALVEKKDIPENYAPKSAVKWKDLQGWLGQEVGVDIPAEDPVLESYFTSRGSVGYKLSEQIGGENKNTRAITMSVDEINSLSRSLVTGDHIDILFTFSVPGLQQKVSTVFLRDVPIIATGSYNAAEQELGSRGGGGKKYGTVTLRLPAVDAMRLNYARQVGQIGVLLRNDKDNAAIDLPPIANVMDLLPANEKEMIDGLLKQKQPSADQSEKLREQFKEIIENQRKQSGRS